MGVCGFVYACACVPPDSDVCLSKWGCIPRGVPDCSLSCVCGTHFRVPVAGVHIVNKRIENCASNEYTPYLF